MKVAYYEVRQDDASHYGDTREATRKTEIALVTAGASFETIAHYADGGSETITKFEAHDPDAKKNTVTVDITFRVTANIDELKAHIGYDASDVEAALVSHISHPIVENNFDTPATVERRHWSAA